MFFATNPTPPACGCAREAVAAHYQGRGQQVDAARIFLTASTSESYSWFSNSWPTPETKCWLPVPSYPLFDYLAGLEAVRAASYPLFYDHGWHIDEDALRKAVNGRTRAIVAVHPNNPTGSYLRRKTGVCSASFVCAITWR